MSGDNLTGLDLSGAKLAGADPPDRCGFGSATIRGATFEGATLTGVKGLDPSTIPRSAK
jgi:uncharacterized protein YjbI with pentapeptide repeats